MKISEQYWEIGNRDLLQQLETSPSGISETEAEKRLSVFGHNVLRKKKQQTGASLFLPFLPMLPKQILLTNFLTDFPEMTIATDEVDRELVEKPRKWDIKFIKRFMIFFGLMSSIFDYITFGVLLFILKADTVSFRTGWFVESVLSASFVVLVIRTRKPFFKSRPGKYLLFATLLIALITIVIPYLPFSGFLGFWPVSIKFFLALAIILFSYITLAEVGKRIFYQRYANEK